MRGRHNETVSPAERQDLIQQTSLALSIGTRKFCPQFDRWRDKLREFIKVELYGPKALFYESSFQIDPANPAVTLHVTDLSSTIAGKYHALASPESVAGMRSSHQKDTFDLASLIVRHRQEIDPTAVLRCFTSDPEQHWPADLSPDALFTAEMKSIAERSYNDRLKASTCERFIEFPQAWQILKDYFEVVRRHR